MADKLSDKIKEGVDTVKDTFRLGYESLYKGDKQAEKDYVERKRAGNPKWPNKSEEPARISDGEYKSDKYASGGRVRGVGVAKRGFGRGKIC